MIITVKFKYCYLPLATCFIILTIDHLMLRVDFILTPTNTQYYSTTHNHVIITTVFDTIAI